MSTAPDEPFLVRAEESEDFWSRDALWSVLVSGERTRGDFTMMEQLMPAHNGAPLHVHDRLHEYFYLLDGEIRFQLGTELVTAQAGGAISIPPGNPHGFVVASATARILNMYTPGGFDDRLRALAVPAGAKTLPPADAIFDEINAEQEASFDQRLRRLHNERWADEVTDLLASARN